MEQKQVQYFHSIDIFHSFSIKNKLKFIRDLLHSHLFVDVVIFAVFSVKILLPTAFFGLNFQISDLSWAFLFQ